MIEAITVDRAATRGPVLGPPGASALGGTGHRAAAAWIDTSADPTGAAWRHVRTGLKLLALALTAVLFALFAMMPEAHADSVMLADSGLLVGRNPTETFSFSAPAGGILDVRLSDLDWPSPLANLTLSITSADQVLGTLNGAGEKDFTLGSAGTYYAHLTGQTTGSLELGAYGLMVYFQGAVAPVPLPASITLLFGGLAATAWSLRRRGGDLILPARNENVMDRA
jgi:hypothetical protein